MTMTTDSIGLYIHIPFCLKKCAYCDFSSYSDVSSDLRERYIDALCKEILSYKDTGLTLDTVFFGGGTPSLLEVSELQRIFESIRNSFVLLPSAEISLEANPGTLNKDKLIGYYNIGINRISIGCQSLCDGELKALGRIHTAKDFYQAYDLVRKVGFKNVNVDIMYGIPNQTLDEFGKTLDKIIEISPEHISMYGLILEPGTQLWNSKDSLALPSEDIECEMYSLAAARLSAFGYSHYEISNYAKDGYKCAHNLKYWRCEEYIGVGLAAHSFFENKRFFNPSTFNQYFDSFECGREVEEILDSESLAYEYAMMRLRLQEGIPLDEYKHLFRSDFLTGREQKIDLYKRLGYIWIENERLSLTERGFYVSNTILSELL